MTSALARNLAAAAVPAVAAVVLLLGCGLVGFALMPARLRPRRARLLAPATLSLGAAAIGWVAYVVGSLLGTGALVAVVALLMLASLARLRPYLRAVAGAGRELILLARASPVAACLTAVPLLAMLPQLLVPVVDSDGLRYHLAYPKQFLLAGRVFHYHWDVSGFYPEAAEMLFLLGLVVDGGEVAKFLHAGFFLAVLATLALAVHRDRGTRTAALLAPFLLAATPLALLPAPAAFVDHIALFHLLAACLLLASRGPVLLVGLALGAAVATKLTAGPAALGLAIVAVSRTFTAPAPARRGPRLLALVGGMALPFLPYAARNVVKTGDPFFPIGYAVLTGGIPGVPRGEEAAVSGFRSHVPGPLGIAWDTSVPGSPPDEVVGIHHLLGLAALLMALRRPDSRLYLGLVFPYLVAAALARPPTRLILPMFAGLAVFEALALTRLRRGWATLSAAVVAAPALLHGCGLVLRNFQPSSYLTGRVPREAYIARHVPGYRAAAFVNARERRGAVFTLDFPACFYVDRRLIISGLTESPLSIWARQRLSAEEMLSRLAAMDVAFLLVTPGYGGGTPGSLLYAAPSPDLAGPIFHLRRRLKLLATIDGVDVYEVPRPAAE